MGRRTGPDEVVHAGEAFGLIVGAIRSVCGPLPPYAEAATLPAADSLPT